MNADGLSKDDSNIWLLNQTWILSNQIIIWLNKQYLNIFQSIISSNESKLYIIGSTIYSIDSNVNLNHSNIFLIEFTFNIVCSIINEIFYWINEIFHFNESIRYFFEIISFNQTSNIKQSNSHSINIHLIELKIYFILSNSCFMKSMTYFIETYFISISLFNI